MESDFFLMLLLEDRKVTSGSLKSVKSSRNYGFVTGSPGPAQCETASQIMVIIFFCMVEMRHWSATRYLYLSCTLASPALNGCGFIPGGLKPTGMNAGCSLESFISLVLRLKSLKLTYFPSIFIPIHDLWG